MPRPVPGSRLRPAGSLGYFVRASGPPPYPLVTFRPGTRSSDDELRSLIYDAGLFDVAGPAVKVEIVSRRK